MRASGLGEPCYVITGQRDSTAAARTTSRPPAWWSGCASASRRSAERTARAVEEGPEAAVTRALGPEHVDPRDIELACRVDAFDFAMEARPVAGLLELVACRRGS